MTDEDFPSWSFDLWFDIKSREELVAHYVATKHELMQIEKLMREHGLEFTDEELQSLKGDDNENPAPGR